MERSNATGVAPTGTGAGLLLNSGAAYLFTRQSRQSAWDKPVFIKAENAGEGDGFGTVVKLSGNGRTLAVAASREDSDALGIQSDGPYNDNVVDSGAVYVYQRNDDATVQFKTFVKSSIAGQRHYGTSIDLSDDGLVMAVGAVRDDRGSKGVFNSPDSLTGGLLASGAVYVYTRTDQDTLWTIGSFIKAHNAKSGDFFGSSVSLSDDGLGLAIGAGAEDSSATGLYPNVDGMADPFADVAAADSGAAYYYRRADTASQWSLETYIKASNTGVSDSGIGSPFDIGRFTGAWTGQVVELSGDGQTLAVSAPGEASSTGGINNPVDATDDDLPNAGAVYLY